MAPVVDRSRWRVLGLSGLFGIASAIALGCGQGPGGERLVAVAGRVTLNGQPLGQGAVIFHPDAAKGNRSQHIPLGSLDAQGTFKLESGKKAGAPLGWYKVAVSSQEPPDPKNPYAPPKHLINPKFADPQTSGLSVEVVEKPAPNAYDFQVSK
jgi:hypothetical protein